MAAPIRAIASLACSILAASTRDSVRPSASASVAISARPSDPIRRVFTRPTPSESNNLNAIETFCDWFSTLFNSSATFPNATSGESLTSSLADSPSASKALTAGPAPAAASARRLVNLCRPTSSLFVSTPVCAAAKRSPASASVVTPSLSACLASASADCNPDFTSATVTAAPAAAAAAPHLAASMVTLPMPLPTLPSAFAILSEVDSVAFSARAISRRSCSVVASIRTNSLSVAVAILPLSLCPELGLYHGQFRPLGFYKCLALFRRSVTCFLAAPERVGFLREIILALKG